MPPKRLKRRHSDENDENDLSVSRANTAGKRTAGSTKVHDRPPTIAESCWLTIKSSWCSLTIKKHSLCMPIRFEGTVLVDSNGSELKALRNNEQIPAFNDTAWLALVAAGLEIDDRRPLFRIIIKEGWEPPPQALPQTEPAQSPGINFSSTVTTAPSPSVGLSTSFSLSFTYPPTDRFHFQVSYEIQIDSARLDSLVESGYGVPGIGKFIIPFLWNRAVPQAWQVFVNHQDRASSPNWDPQGAILTILPEEESTWPEWVISAGADGAGPPGDRGPSPTSSRDGRTRSPSLLGVPPTSPARLLVGTEHRSHQTYAVAWMREVERKTLVGESFEIESLWYPQDFATRVDFRSQMLLRADSRPTSARLRVTSRGGILADQVGLGKTVCILGLVASDSTEEAEGLRHRGALEDGALDDGTPYLRSTATMIVCGESHLVAQWRDEIRARVPKSRQRVVTIVSQVDHQKISYRDIVLADYVIVSADFLKNTKGHYAPLGVGEDNGRSLVDYNKWRRGVRREMQRLGYEIKRFAATRINDRKPVL
ncbi:hypothetical protein HDU93_009380, partial [Gonapodya sp. JEL0774]